MTATEMIQTHPMEVGLDADLLGRTIEALIACAQTCTACADACLGEDQVDHMRRCITTDLNCADVCTAAARVLSRQTEYDATVTKAVLEACATVCGQCASECEQHAEMGMDHCRICAEQCRSCEDLCRQLLEQVR
ncbi:four-helix bundle copper-binding protein [soil metagenome]